jgi:hypothetical protein
MTTIAVLVPPQATSQPVQPLVVPDGKKVAVALGGLAAREVDQPNLVADMKKRLYGNYEPSSVELKAAIEAGSVGIPEATDASAQDAQTTALDGYRARLKSAQALTKLTAANLDRVKYYSARGVDSAMFTMHYDKVERAMKSRALLKQNLVSTPLITTGSSSSSALKTHSGVLKAVYNRSIIQNKQTNAERQAGLERRAPTLKLHGERSVFYPTRNTFVFQDIRGAPASILRELANPDSVSITRQHAGKGIPTRELHEYYERKNMVIAHNARREKNQGFISRKALVKTTLVM